ncbi:hypothetical protein [Streptomyces sp. NPDC085540]|uniref:hypothetical protein n=1 Tax=Streptomyces sp. NPDC085540 TaxID=3365730 RepID=UPI0037D1DBEA
MKAQLVAAPRLMERVVMQSEADPVLLTSSRGPLSRLTERAGPDDQAERSSFGVEPETDSGVGVWLDVLHRHGSRVAASELLTNLPVRQLAASFGIPKSTAGRIVAADGSLGGPCPG